MNSFKYFKIKISLSILMGLGIASIPYVSATADIIEDSARTETTEQRLARMAAEKAGKVARVEALVQTWLHSGEQKDSLFQAFYALSEVELSAIEAADNYESVRVIAFGQGLTLAARDVQARLGATAEDLVYTPVSPCRIASSRDLPSGADPFTDNTTRSFFAYGAAPAISAQGGDAAGCAAPRSTDPSAVHININVIPVVTDPPINSGKGTIKVAPKGEAATTNTVLVKFNAGTNSSNAVTVKTCVGCGEEIDVRTTGNNVHVILEVLGYYYPVDKDDADRMAVAYGYINADGTKNSGTENVTSTWDAVNEWYEITIADEPFGLFNTTAVITSGNRISCPDGLASLDAQGGNMLVSFLDVNGTGAGSTKQCPFNFVTFKNQ